MKIQDAEEMFILVNGIRNDKLISSPDYLYKLREDIIKNSEKDLSNDDFVLASTYHNSVVLKMLGLVNTVSGGLSDISNIFKLFNPSSSNNSNDSDQSGFISKLIDFAQGGSDVSKFLDEIADPKTYSEISTDIQEAIAKHFESFKSNVGRSIVAVGYSGGFLPLTEVLQRNPYDDQSNTGYNLSGLVALGAATYAFQDRIQEFLDKATSILFYLEKAIQSTTSLISKIEEEFDEMLDIAIGLNLPGLPENWKSNILNLVNIASFAQAQNSFVDAMIDVVKHLGDTPHADLKHTNLKVLANVYGSKDSLKRFGIGGYQTELAGYRVNNPSKPLINIEIVGAGHSDYMRPGYQGDQFTKGLFGLGLDIANNLSSTADKAWQRTVADFVAGIAANSQNQETLKDFLRNSGFAKESLEGPGYWVVTLPDPRSAL